jgi:hypothetical protein
MKYIKTYENIYTPKEGDYEIAYSVDDIVIRISHSNAEIEEDVNEIGEKYIVKEIYTYDADTIKGLDKNRIRVKSITYEQIESNEYYTIAQNIKTKTNSPSNRAARFVNEYNWTTIKYNL